MNDESTADKGTWGSETSGSTWITVDLGSVKAVRYLRVGGLGANGCWSGTGESYFTGVSIDLSPDGSAWTNVPSFEFKYSNTVIGNIDIGIGNSARYVRISKSGWLTMGQLRVGKDSCAWVAGSSACWYDSGSTGVSCTTACSTHGGYHADTKDFAGSDGTNANCAEVAKAVHNLGSPPSISTNSYTGIGCTHYSSGSYGRDTVATTASATDGSEVRICGCVN